jgi:uncharacterized protein YndB with AHSA1/START domain
MLTQEATLHFTRTVQADPAAVFRAFTTPSALRDWLCDAARVDPRKGGPIYLWWNDGYYTGGVFTEVVRNAELAFTWRGPEDPAASQVHVALTPAAGGTTVAVTHAAPDADPAWAAAAAEIARGWEQSLENLQSLLEIGVDLRFARRPMVGIDDAESLTPELAARLGVPITEGLRLRGLVDGMGAQAAGLQRDDIMVQLGEYPITDYQGLARALQHYQAGDRVPVVFYRGPRQQTLTMELSRRPQPDLPATSAALAEVMRASYAALDDEMAACFAGASEEATAYRPGPEEWNAKEILGHLLAIEHDTQAWIAAVIEDSDMEQIFHTNVTERVAALAQIYTPTPVLLEELRRSEAVTVALIAALPATAVERKHLFNQLATWLTTFADHTREHIAEIRGLLTAARQ